MANLQLGIAGALASAFAIFLYELTMEGVTGLTGSRRRKNSHRIIDGHPRRRRVPESLGQGSLDQRAGPGRLDRLARLAFTSAMTRPMSFIDEAPSSAMIAWIAALPRHRPSAGAGSARSPRSRPLPWPPAPRGCPAVELDRFAALLDHLLQHFGHQLVVVRLLRSGAKLDVAIPDRRLDQADRRRPFLVAALHRANQRSLDLVANHRDP